MIKATVFKNSTDSGNAVYTGIVMEGHAGYADEGEDIICAAVSALALNFSHGGVTQRGGKGGNQSGKNNVIVVSECWLPPRIPVPPSTLL